MKKILLGISVLLAASSYKVNAQCGVKLNADKNKFCSDKSAILTATPSDIQAIPDFTDSKQVFNVADLKLDQTMISLIQSGVLQNVSYPFSQSTGTFALSLNGYQLKNTVISSGTIDVSIVTDLKQDLKVVFELPYFTIGGKPIKDSILVDGKTAKQGKQTYSKSFDLKNAIVDFSAGDNTKYNLVKYVVKPSIKITTTTFTAQETGDLKIDLKNLSFTENISYSWFKNGNILQGMNTPSIEVNQSGKYKVQTISNCGTSLDSLDIEVVQMPSKEITTTGNLTFCEGDSVNLQAVGNGDYKWTNNAITNAVTIKKAGIYSVTITNDICSVNSNPIEVVVNKNPEIQLSHKDTTIIVGSEFTLTAKGGKEYEWNDKTTLDSIKITEAGTYTVIGKNEAGCSATASIKVDVREKGAGINSLNKVSLAISPNPVSEVLTVKTESYKNNSLVIVDLKGNQILSQNLTGINTEINVNAFAKGIYMVNIIDNSNNVLNTQRFVVE